MERYVTDMGKNPPLGGSPATRVDDRRLTSAARKRVKGTFVGDAPFEPMPLDVAILKMLPEHGSKVGKYLWDAKRANTITKELDSEGLTVDMISGRLRLMRGYALCTEVPLLGGTSKGKGWQRTEAGATMAKRVL